MCHRYQPSQGSDSSCIQCAEGRYQEEREQTECLDCPDDKQCIDGRLGIPLVTCEQCKEEGSPFPCVPLSRVWGAVARFLASACCVVVGLALLLSEPLSSCREKAGVW